VKLPKIVQVSVNRPTRFYFQSMAIPVAAAGKCLWWS